MTGTPLQALELLMNASKRQLPWEQGKAKRLLQGTAAGRAALRLVAPEPRDRAGVQEFYRECCQASVPGMLTTDSVLLICPPCGTPLPMRLPSVETPSSRATQRVHAYAKAVTVLGRTTTTLGQGGSLLKSCSPC